MPAATALSLRDVRVRGQGRPVLRGVSLDICHGETFALVAPDRAERDALLRAACGLLGTTDGHITVAGSDVTRRPPHRRGVALAPSLPVGGGTLARALRRTASGRDVSGLLEIPALAAHAATPVAQLPSFIRRCAGLAQAAASAPACVLIDMAGPLDEAALAPLMWLLGYLTGEGMAALVAADSGERAMRCADRGGILLGGALRVTGRLQDLHDRPADEQTAMLLGACNRLEGEVVAGDDEEGWVQVRLRGGDVVEAAGVDLPKGSACVVCIRPDRIALSSVQMDDLGGHVLRARVAQVRGRGEMIELAASLGRADEGSDTLLLRRPAGLSRVPTPGAEVALAWAPHHALAFRRQSVA